MEVYISKATGETSEDTKQAVKEPPPPLKKHLEITFQVLNQWKLWIGFTGQKVNFYFRKLCSYYGQTLDSKDIF